MVRPCIRNPNAPWNLWTVANINPAAADNADMTPTTDPKTPTTNNDANVCPTVPTEYTINSVKFNTKDIYANEDLTKTRSELLYRARQAKRNGQLEDVWSYGGMIRIKDNKGLVRKITNAKDLEKVISGEN